MLAVFTKMTVGEGRCLVRGGLSEGRGLVRGGLGEGRA